MDTNFHKRNTVFHFYIGKPKGYLQNLVRVTQMEIPI